MEGDICGYNENQFTGISIHSLRMEGDRCCQRQFFRIIYFNPLPPHGGRQNLHGCFGHGDHFNPLPPHGGRRQDDMASAITNAFQSTPSAWRETTKIRCWNLRNGISIHSLRMEGDQSIWFTSFFSPQFQSTPSAWRETPLISWGRQFLVISIHSLRMEGDATPSAIRYCSKISIHSLRMEGDQARPARLCPTLHFNPLPPHGGRPK